MLSVLAAARLVWGVCGLGGAAPQQPCDEEHANP